jgi:Protein of unknown function (DUF3040)
MPLSEQEQRLLDEMERSLYQNDADFVATVGGRRGRLNYTALVAGVLVAVLGVGVLVSGVILQQPLIGVLGFVVMFGGVLLAFGSPRRGAATMPSSSPTSSRRGSRTSFMDRMNARWDRRQDGMGR